MESILYWEPVAKNLDFDIIDATRKVVQEMAVINEIKQRILQLDAGSFQSMCDRYLSKIGYPNIVSLGTQAGTQKTTRGTPDTYFFDANGKYVFVEYTTQQSNLPDKIRADIQKCLDVSKTQIPHEKISEIIYCHTSANIAPKDDADFRAMCENAGIQFSIYGIDRLAQDFYLKYRGIAKDQLHIAIEAKFFRFRKILRVHILLHKRNLLFGNFPQQLLFEMCAHVRIF